MLYIAIAGYGQITKTQHIPVLQQMPDYTIVAIIDPTIPKINGLPVFSDLKTLHSSGIRCHCVALCTPPEVRYALAREAISLGMHVLLEKPPTVAHSQLDALLSLARLSNRTLFTAWHSRYAARVEAAKQLLRGRRVKLIEIDWCEDHEAWHPDSTWLWKAGGFGAFDAGVNALTLLEAVMGCTLIYGSARLEFEPGAQTPIRADVTLTTRNDDTPVRAWFDIGWKGDVATWDITWHLEDGRKIIMRNGGASLLLDDRLFDDHLTPVSPQHAEYQALYTAFSALISRNESEIYSAPYVIATDCLAHGQRVHGRLSRWH